MTISRREFLHMLAIASASGINLAGCDSGSDTQKQAKGVKNIKEPGNLYEVPAFGNVSLMHYTDCHAQLQPVYFREPNINIGVGSMQGQPPHLVGEALLKHYGIPAGGPLAHANTYLDYVEAARLFGKVGGFAHLSSLVKTLRGQRPGALLLHGGDDTTVYPVNSAELARRIGETGGSARRIEYPDVGHVGILLALAV